MNKNRATKSLSILLAMCMLLGMLPMTALADNFSDIKGHWAESQINEMINEGIVKGYPDGSFKPDGDISRAEFVSLIVKAFKLTKAKGKDFDDISNHWAKDAILTANAHGIVNGYSDTKFGPDDPITREQMAVIIVKVAHLTDNSKGKTFVDSQDISEWAKKAVAIASSNQLITGYPDNTFKPSANTSRAEATAVLSKSIILANLAAKVDYSLIEKSGKYGPETGDEIVKGDVVIKAKDTILQNLVIKGDLTIAKEVGDGDVTLNNIKVEGKTYIRGGGIDSIYINGGEYREIIIERTITGAVRIVVTNIQGLTITISENDNGEDVILNGEIKTVTIKADGIKVISQGETTIDKIEVTRGLKDVKIELTEDTEVKEIILDSKVDVKGKGEIEKGSGSKIRESTFVTAPKRIITPSTGGNGSSSSGGTSTTPTIKVSAISVTTPPTKTEYEIGEAIDLAGLVATATYSDSSSKVVAITSDMISGFDSSSAEVDQVVTVTYEGKTATFKVTIKEATPVVDKTVLNAALAEANAKVEADYTAASWSEFQSELATATAMAETTQAEVDAKLAAVNAAIAKLVEKVPVVDKTALNSAISAANTNKESVEVSLDGEDVEPSKQWVTSAVKSAYAAAITDAKTVADKADATQVEVDTAVTTLATATTAFNGEKKDGTKPAPIDKYAVTFSAGDNGNLTATVDGTEINSGDEVEKGKDVIFTATPDEGYKVKEWKVDGTVISETDNSYTVNGLSAAITVTVEFEKIAKTYKVRFNSGGANGDMDPVEVVKGEKYTLPEHSFTALQHKKFDHWKVENSDTKYEPDDEIEITGDIWIYANWVTIPIEIWDAPAKVLPGHASSISIFINGIGQNGAEIEAQVNFTITGADSSGTSISQSGYLKVGSDETAGQFILRATKQGEPNVYDEVTIKVVPSNALTIKKDDESIDKLSTDGYKWDKDSKTLTIQGLTINGNGQGIVFDGFNGFINDDTITLELVGTNKIDIEAGDLTQVNGIGYSGSSPYLIIKGTGSLEITMPDLGDKDTSSSYGIRMYSLTVEDSASLKITNVKAKDARGIWTSKYTTFKDNAKVEVESYGWVIDAHGGMNPKISIEGNAEFKGTAQGVDPIFLTTDGINIEKGTTVELVRPNFTDTTGKPKFFDYGKDKTLNLAPELKLQGSESEDGSGLVDAKLSGDKPEKVVRKSDDKDVFKYVLIKAGEVTQYDVNVAYVVGGTAEVSVDKDKAKAAAGETVTVSVANIESGKQFKSITIIDADNGTVATTEVTAGESYTFAMPAKNVTVTVTVEEEIEKTVTVGEMQGGSIYAGVSATSKTYNVITTGIADGKYATVKWYGDINKTDNGNTAPAGISIASVNNSPVQDNKIELKVTVQNAANTVQGNYFFTVTIDEVESEVKTFTIEKTNLIDTVTINGLSVPVVGETPYDKNNLSVPENAGYVIDAVSWYDHTKADNNGSGWGVEEFEQGHKYQININLKLEDGYQFASNKNYVLDELDANSYEKVQWGAVGDAQLSIIFKELE